MISKEKKFFKGNTRGKNIFHGLKSWKKSYTVVCRRKRNYITTGLGKKNHYPNQITHTPSNPPKKSNGRHALSTHKDTSMAFHAIYSNYFEEQ